MGIADRTPKRRASYDAVDTTPRPPSPPTITGLPRNDGLSRCSTAAKKASRSRWRIDASGRTAAPHPGGHRHRQHGAHPIRPPLDRLRDRRVEPTSDAAGEAALRQARGPDGRPRLSPSDRVSPCRGVAMETEELVAFMRTRGMAVVATTHAEGAREQPRGDGRHRARGARVRHRTHRAHVREPAGACIAWPSLSGGTSVRRCRSRGLPTSRPGRIASAVPAPIPPNGQAEQRVRKTHPEHSSGSRRDGYGPPTSGPALPACAKPPGPDRHQPARRADQPSSTRGCREKVTYAQPPRGVREVSAQSSGSISGNRVSTSGAWSTSVMSRSVVYGQNSR